MATKKTAKKKDSKTVGDGLPMFELASLSAPSAFHPTIEGAQAALAAAAPALALLTDIQLLCAGLEIAQFFKAHPGVESFDVDEGSESDDEGHSWIETRVRVEFTDGTTDHDYECDLNEPVAGQPDDSPDRYSLSEETATFADELMDRLPLARANIIATSISRASALIFAGAAAAARQEAFAISRAIKPASELALAEAARL